MGRDGHDGDVVLFLGFLGVVFEIALGCSGASPKCKVFVGIVKLLSSCQPLWFLWEFSL